MSASGGTGPDPADGPAGPVTDDGGGDGSGADARVLGPQPRPERARPAEGEERGPAADQ